MRIVLSCDHEHRGNVWGNHIASKLGALSSGLCLIHCIGMALLTPIFPLLEILVDSHWIELGLWSLSAFTAGWQAKNSGWLRRWFIAAIIVGSAGLLFEIHGMLHGGFLTVAIGSIMLLWKRVQAHRNTFSQPKVT